MIPIGAHSIKIVVAIANNNVIGKNNKLPWHLPGDLKHFAKITSGAHLLMGSETFNSIGKPLPGRQNLVLTRDPAKFQGFNGSVQAIGSVAEALDFSRKHDLYLIGGQAVFEQFIGCAEISTMHITRVFADVQGDRHFPLYDYSRWRLINDERHPNDYRNEFAFSFETWVKK